MTNYLFHFSPTIRLIEIVSVRHYAQLTLAPEGIA